MGCLTFALMLPICAAFGGVVALLYLIITPKGFDQ